MIWKRINENLTRQEKAEKSKEKEKVSPKDLLAMIVSAYATILLPCLLVLVGLCALVMWLFGML